MQCSTWWLERRGCCCPDSPHHTSCLSAYARVCNEFKTTVLKDNVSHLLGMDRSSMWESLTLKMDRDILDLTTSFKQRSADGQNSRMDAKRFRSELHRHVHTLTRVEQARGEGEGEEGGGEGREVGGLPLQQVSALVGECDSSVSTLYLLYFERYRKKFGFSFVQILVL